MCFWEGKIWRLIDGLFPSTCLPSTARQLHHISLHPPLSPSPLSPLSIVRPSLPHISSLVSHNSLTRFHSIRPHVHLSRFHTREVDDPAQRLVRRAIRRSLLLRATVSPAFSFFPSPPFPPTPTNLPPPSPWFRTYSYMEALYQLPLILWAIPALLRNSPYIPLHLLVFAVHVSITTLTCFVEMRSWEELKEDEGGWKRGVGGLGGMYGVYLGLGECRFERLRWGIG